MVGLALLLLGALHSEAALGAARDSRDRQQVPQAVQVQTAFAFLAAHREATRAVQAGLGPETARQASAFAAATHLRHCSDGRTVLTYADADAMDAFLQPGLRAELGRQAGGTDTVGALKAGTALGFDPRPHLPPDCSLPPNSVWLLTN